MLISSRSIWPVNRSLSRIIDTKIEPLPCSWDNSLVLASSSIDRGGIQVPVSRSCSLQILSILNRSLFFPFLKRHNYSKTVIPVKPDNTKDRSKYIRKIFVWNIKTNLTKLKLILFGGLLICHRHLFQSIERFKVYIVSKLVQVS